MPRIQLALGSSGHPGGRDQVLPTVTQRERSLPLQAGMGERFTITSKPGPGQQVVLVRALEPYRTQPPHLFPHPEAW